MQSVSVFIFGVYGFPVKSIHQRNARVHRGITASGAAHRARGGGDAMRYAPGSLPGALRSQHLRGAISKFLH